MRSNFYKKIQINPQKNGVEIELTYEVLEEIGTKEKIVFWKDG